MLKGRIISVGGPRAVLKEFAPIMKDTLQEVADVWWRRMLPKHFRHSAKAEYGYKTRTRLHQLKKSRRYHHQRPLEFTGDLKRQLMRRSRITGTRTRVTVHLLGPRYLYMHQANSRQPDMAGEITKTTAAEQGRLSDLLDRKSTRKLNEVKARETVTR